jgi:hypothetical protein
MKAFFVRIWEGWKRFAFWLGEKQAILIYTVIYFAVVGPIALLRRPFADPLQWRGRHRPSFWVPRVQAPATVEEAMRQ